MLEWGVILHIAQVDYETHTGIFIRTLWLLREGKGGFSGNIT